MSNILVTVDEQNLHITDAPKIAAQGVNENYIIFTFDVSWSGFAKVALFYREEDEATVYESMIDQEGKALVPHEVTDEDGKICFGIAGLKDDVIYTSEILKYKIVKGKYTAGQETEPPTPGIYEQMLTIASNIETLLDNTPYLYYDGDEGPELPIHTINDSVTSFLSTWSSQKIADEISGGTSIQELNTRVSSLESNVSGVDQDIAGLTSDVTTLNNQVNSLLPTFIQAVDSGTMVGEKKGDVEGGCYKIGNLVIVDLKITMTTTYNQQNHYTGLFAELGEGLVPAQGRAALSAFVNLSNEQRYTLTAFANSASEIENYGTLNIGSPSLILTSGMEIHVNGAYAVSTV